jgi:hypothetical protein
MFVAIHGIIDAFWIGNLARNLEGDLNPPPRGNCAVVMESEMIDLIALAGLFAEVFGASKDCTEPKVARFEQLNDADKGPKVIKLKAKGHMFIWAREARLRQLKREGWEPVFERDAIGRPTIFVDRLEELVLVRRPPPIAA